MPRQSNEDRIKRLEEQIRAIKERAERKTIRSSPSIKFMSGALRSIDKAIHATDDSALRQALDEARGTVSACLGLCGVQARSARGMLVPRARGGARSNGRPDPDSLLEYVKSNPGSRSEDLTAALGTNAAALRPVMHALIAEGKVRTEGQRRGMRYWGQSPG